MAAAGPDTARASREALIAAGGIGRLRRDEPSADEPIGPGPFPAAKCRLAEV